MGIFDGLLSAASEATEKAHGTRLVSDMHATIKLVGNAHPEVESKAWLLFLELHEDVLKHSKNWSKDGTLRVAKDFYATARKSKDLDIGTSYGYALAGCFTEGLARTSVEAALVVTHLGTLGIELQRQAESQRKNLQHAVPQRSQSGPDEILASLAERTLLGMLIVVFWPCESERKVGDFLPRLEAWEPADQKLMIFAVYGVIDGICQANRYDDSLAMACFTRILSRDFLVEHEDIASLAREAMAAARRDDSSTECIVLGGRAGMSMARDPGDTAKVAAIGSELRKLISSPFW